ncbi:MAG: HAD family hydrolase [Clostridia bacterium]|nr:HAD family hydrolase [Clostridia bacterium]
MGIFTGKLLVSDMDATLLDSRGRISDRNRQAIDYFISEGGYFTVASGRMVSAVRAYFDRMRINAPAILHNGAKLYDYSTETAVYENFIEKERKPIFRRVRDEHPELGIEIYSDETVYVYRKNFATERFKTKPYKVVYELPEEVWQRPWIKALIIGTREQLDAFEPIYRRDYDKGYSVRSGDCFLDIVATGSSKGAGLIRLAGELGVTETYAVGDNMNDIDMLRAAHRSYAVANAEPEVKAVADENAPSCDESPVEYIVRSIKKMPDGISTPLTPQSWGGRVVVSGGNCVSP